MPAHSDALLNLIAHTSTDECKLFVERVATNYVQYQPQYLELFQLIIEHQPDSAEALKKLVTGTNLEKNFTFTKHYLRRQLEEFLSEQEEGNSQEAIISYYIRSAQMYFERGMEKEANSRIRKARKLAAEISSLGFLYEVNKIERRFRIGVAFIPPSQKAYQDENEREEQIVKSMQNMIALRQLQYETDVLARSASNLTRPMLTEKIQLLFDHPLLKGRHLLTFPAEKLKAIDILANLHNTIDDQVKVKDSREEMVEIILGNEQTAKRDYLYTLTMCYNYVAALFDIDDLEGIKKISQRLSDMLNTGEEDTYSVKHRNALFILTNIDLIGVWLSEDDVAFQEVVERGNRFLASGTTNLVPGFHLFFLENVGQIYFLKGQPKEALEYFDRLYNEPEMKPVADMNMGTRLRRLLCLIDLDDDVRLMSNIDSTQKYLTRNNLISPFIRLIINGLSKSATARTEEQLGIYKDLLLATENTINDTDSIALNPIFNEDLKWWLERKMEVLNSK